MAGWVPCGVEEGSATWVAFFRFNQIKITMPFSVFGESRSPAFLPISGESLKLALCAPFLARTLHLENMAEPAPPTTPDVNRLADEMAQQRAEQATQSAATQRTLKMLADRFDSEHTEDARASSSYCVRRSTILSRGAPSKLPWVLGRRSPRISWNRASSSSRAAWPTTRSRSCSPASSCRASTITADDHLHSPTHCWWSGALIGALTLALRCRSPR